MLIIVFSCRRKASPSPPPLFFYIGEGKTQNKCKIGAKCCLNTSSAVTRNYSYKCIIQANCPFFFLFLIQTQTC